MASTGYQLKSDLARVCLPAPGRSVPRRLAWANSISLLFLFIGILGAQSRMPSVKPVPPLEQPVPIMVEPTPPAPAPTVISTETEQSDDEKPQSPVIQAVTMDTPAINFAVPTPGSLVVPLSVASAPKTGGTGVQKKAVQVKQEAPSVPGNVENTGEGGLRPRPDVYPPIAQKLGQQGTVTLLLTVNDSGAVLSAEIKESSGSIILDTAAQKWVQRHWIVLPVKGSHSFTAPIHYVLR